jgi:hypothetical protein
VAAIGLVGCRSSSHGQGPDPAGPIDFGSGATSICAEADAPRHIFYEQFFRLRTQQVATVVSATSNAQGLEVANYFLAIDPRPAIGVVDAPLPPKERAKLKPLEGTEIPPGSTGFVITEVTYSGSPATATDTDLLLTYKLGETTYKATFPNKFTIGQC